MKKLALASLAIWLLTIACETSAQRRFRNTGCRRQGNCRIASQLPASQGNSGVGLPVQDDPGLNDPALLDPALLDPALGVTVAGDPVLGEAAMNNPALSRPIVGTTASNAPPRRPVIGRRQFRNSTQARNFQTQLMRVGMRTSLQRSGNLWTVSFATAARPAAVVGMAAGFNPQALLGLAPQTARSMTARAGYSLRVVSQDGRPSAISQDFRRNRINVTVVAGRIVRATIG